MITSTRNPKVQLVRNLTTYAKARRENQAFVVEGVRLVEEALHAGWEAQLVLYSPDLSTRGLVLVEAFESHGAPVEAVDARVLKAAADTETPQGILAVLRMQPPVLPAEPDFVLILDGLRDPGNLGTILRTARAAAVQAVLLLPATADPYAPKVVRAAMGAHFRLPVRSLDWSELLVYLNPGGMAARLNVYLADSSGGLPYTQADFRSPFALIVGGEAEGAGAQAQSLAQSRVHIPMPGRAESLNAAIAAGILMFEAARQRQV